MARQNVALFGYGLNEQFNQGGRTRNSPKLSDGAVSRLYHCSHSCSSASIAITFFTHNIFVKVDVPRKPGNTCASSTIMTLAVKVAVNSMTTNQSKVFVLLSLYIES